MIRKYIKLELSYVDGSDNGTNTRELLKAEQLKDTVPFNHDPGLSYNYQIYDSEDNVISFGDGEWILDTDSGVLTFYQVILNNVSRTKLPKIMIL